MIFDAREIPQDAVIEADICIVGGGPAGITAALELASSSALRIVLLESGGLYYDEDTQALNAGSILGLDYDPLDEARLRFLGGSSNHWAGNCMRLTPLDFEKRDWMPNSGWPISFSDIEPFYDRASPYVEIQQDRSFDFDYWARKLGGDPIDWDPAVFENVVSCSSPPTAFGFTYEDQLRAAPNLRVYLNANVLEIETNETASEVIGLRVATIGGPTFRAEATTYVLAQGGIEVARLLMLSNSVIPGGLGNAHDQVGRYFGDHPGVRPALTIWPRFGEKQFRIYEGPTMLDVGGFWGIVASSDALRRSEEVGGFMFNFLEARLSPGHKSAEALVRSFKSGSAPRYLSHHVMNLFRDLDGLTNAVYEKMSGGDDLFDRHWIAPWFGIECVPNPESRVVLVDGTDRFGQLRVGLDWRFVEQDLLTTKRAVELMVREVGRLGLGRTFTEVTREDYDWPDYIARGKHAISTARMSETSKSGVVDGNCRVHDMANLYIAGSAVFSTHGYVQPTYSIVAFSIRLADHLKALHGEARP